MDTGDEFYERILRVISNSRVGEGVRGWAGPWGGVRGVGWDYRQENLQTVGQPTVGYGHKAGGNHRNI